jgi:hypothetical protein
MKIHQTFVESGFLAYVWTWMTDEANILTTGLTKPAETKLAF